MGLDIKKMKIAYFYSYYYYYGSFISDVTVLVIYFLKLKLLDFREKDYLAQCQWLWVCYVRPVENSKTVKCARADLDMNQNNTTKDWLSL